MSTDAGLHPAENLWDQILARVETKVNRHSFYTWFKPTTFVADGGKTVTVRVPNDLFRDWLTKHYAGVISESVDELQRQGTQITFVTAGPSDAATAVPTPDIVAPTVGPPRSVAPLNQRYTLFQIRRGSIESICSRSGSSRR